jgi:hypothetical protein
MAQFNGFARDTDENTVAMVTSPKGRTFSFAARPDGGFQARVQPTADEMLPEAQFEARYGLSFKDMPKDFPQQPLDLDPLMAAARQPAATPAIKPQGPDFGTAV